MLIVWGECLMIIGASLIGMAVAACLITIPVILAVKGGF